MTPLRARADALGMREDLDPGCSQGEAPGDGRNAFQEIIGFFKIFSFLNYPQKKSSGEEGKRKTACKRPTQMNNAK